MILKLATPLLRRSKRVCRDGWIIRALDVDERFVTAETLTSECDKVR